MPAPAVSPPCGLVALLLALALVGCGGSDRPGASTSGACAAMPGPEPLLIEERTERPQIDPYVRRVTEDGVFHERTSTRIVIEGDDMRFETQPLEWRERWTVPEAALQSLRSAIRESGILDAPAEVEPDGTSIGGSEVTWTVCIDGRSHTTVLRAAPDASHPATMALKTALDRAAQAGADAAREGGG